MTILDRIVAATVLVALAACQPTDRGDKVEEATSEILALADTDGDAAISLAEWDTLNDRLFNELDIDADGVLATSELQQSFDVFDLNGNGVLEPFEAPLLIGTADLNGDFLVDPQEYRRFDWADYAADLNRNGGVTLQELRRARRDAFYSWDRNLNGLLHRDEIDEFVVPMIRIPF